jgi:hypothetical protein
MNFLPQKAGSKLRLTIALATLTLTMGCANTQVNDSAICDGTSALRTGAAQGQLEDGGPIARRSTLALLDALKAGCNE